MQIQFDSFSPHIDVWMDTLVNRSLREKDYVAWGAKIQTRIPEFQNRQTCYYVQSNQILVNVKIHVYWKKFCAAWHGFPTNCEVMHFEKLHSHQLVGKAQENVLKDLKNKELNFMLQSNIDQPFTENDTKAVIKLLKSEKGPRPDRKRSEMLKCGIHILATTTEVLICVTSCLGKLFCSLLNKRLSNFVEANNLTHSSQIGLIKGLIEQLITFSR